MRDPVATVAKLPATCYAVRNGFAWAYIFVRHGVTSDGPASEARYWVHVSVLSDFGECGFCWSHIGTDWRAFLAGLDFDYASRKMWGDRRQVDLGPDEAGRNARRLVLDQRRQQSLSKADARTLWDVIADAAGDAANAPDFLRLWDDRSGGLMYRHELYDSAWKKPNPQAEAFWREIWPPFVSAISAPECATEAA